MNAGDPRAVWLADELDELELGLGVLDAPGTDEPTRARWQARLAELVTYVRNAQPARHAVD